MSENCVEGRHPQISTPLYRSRYPVPACPVHRTVVVRPVEPRTHDCDIKVVAFGILTWVQTKYFGHREQEENGGFEDDNMNSTEMISYILWSNQYGLC